MDNKQDKDTGKLILENQNEKVTKVQETVQSKPDFEEQLEDAAKQNKEQFYKDVLKQADIRIKAQEEQLKNVQSQQVEFRDEIAIRCFIPLIPLISDSDNYRRAATDAYRAADDFLRVREGAEVE